MSPAAKECDLVHLEELYQSFGSQIRGILVNNPSNPTGCVYSKDHLESLVKFAQRHHLPIVADEVYGDLTFQRPFLPLADVAAARVPVITASGIGKQYLLPGWRVGWVVFHDNIHGSLREVEAGAKRLAQVILGASHLAQTAIVKVLNTQDESVAQWKDGLRSTLEQQARFLCDKLGECSGLQVLKPQGAMYSIARIDFSKFDESVQSDLCFTQLLLEEENVFVLPGCAFGVPGMFRVVFCAPESVLETAAARIKSFCDRHSA